MRVITGGNEHNDGFLKVESDAGTDWRTIVDSNHRHELGTTVMFRCEKDPIALKISGVSEDGWVGSIEFSDNFGASWGFGDCVDCTEPHTLCDTIMVDADAEVGQNSASASCIGVVCQVMESTTTTTTTTTTEATHICSYVKTDTDADNTTASTGDYWSSNMRCDNTTASNTESVTFVTSRWGCNQACSARAKQLSSLGLGCCQWQRAASPESGVYPCTWHQFDTLLTDFINFTNIWETLTNESQDSTDQLALCINQ